MGSFSRTRLKAPPLAVSLSRGGTWDLHAPSSGLSGARLHLLLFYRGLHCPLCRKQLEEAAGLQDQMSALGMEALAISMDGPEKCAAAASEWQIGALRLGFGLSEAQARDWGLFLSRRQRDGEPDIFNEPALFVIDGANQSILYTAACSAPWGRPALSAVLNGLKLSMERGLSPRGEA